MVAGVVRIKDAAKQGSLVVCSPAGWTGQGSGTVLVKMRDCFTRNRNSITEGGKEERRKERGHGWGALTQAPESWDPRLSQSRCPDSAGSDLGGGTLETQD